MAETGGVLIVRVFKHPSVDTYSGSEDETTKRVPGVRVDIVSPVVLGTRTDDNGEARFGFLGAGSYQIKVRPPDGYEDPTASPLTITVPASGEKLQLMELKLKPVLIKVKLDNENGVLNGVTGIRVDARQDDRPLPPLFLDPEVQGQFEIRTPGDGVEIRPESPLVVDERTLVPDPPSRVVSTLPGAEPEIEFVYKLRLGAIVLDATSIKTVDDDEEEREQLAGVAFKLFKGLVAEGRPIREATSSNRSATRFSDLDQGEYAIVAILPDALKEQGLQQTQPVDPVLRVALVAGETHDLRGEFEFRPALGSVEGAVVLNGDNAAVPGVRLTLILLDEPGTVATATTSATGEFVFRDLEPGTYSLAFEQLPVSALGASWTPKGDAVRRVEVRPRATAQVEDFRLVEEEHRLFGLVESPDGQPVPFAAVQIRRTADPNDPDNVLATVVTDERGRYEFKAETPGTFFVTLVEQDGFIRQLFPVNVNQPAQAPTLIAFTRRSATPVAGDGAQPATPSPDLTDFPLLTEEVDLARRAQPAGPAGGIGTVGQTVERALRDVLGWRPKASDPKGFMAALEQAFTCQEVEGHTECRWTPRSYAVEVQADMGAVTGAQASIYTRARNTLDQVLPLLEGLKPLRVEFDPEETEALRAIVRSEASELVSELGVEGGPRVQRVDQLFRLLLGPVPTFDANAVEGNLKRLRERFGLEAAGVNTIGEEEVLTNYLVIVDYLNALRQSWELQRGTFDRANPRAERFLGTQLVLLSRALAVASESVREVEFTMDSVFLGPAERQTLELTFPATSRSAAVLRTGYAANGSSPPMFVADLLAWVERFASEEGPQLIREGGKLGARAFVPTIDLLRSLVRDAMVAPAGAQDGSKLPASYRVPRVQRALQELADQLDDCFELVQQFGEDDNSVTAAQQPGLRVRGRPRRDVPIPAPPPSPDIN